jgi:UDP-glucose 4-epimerase
MVDARLRVVVTGGAGFIGSRVALAYRRRGDQVLVVDDLSGGSRASLPDGVDFAKVDITDPSTGRRIADFRPELVVHAAAQVSVPRSVADPDRDAEVNVAGTAQVVAGARAGGASRLVFLSSGGAVYGDADGADEDAPAAPRSPYGRSKLEAEALVRLSGLSSGIARLANVYGPGQRSDLEGGVVAIFLERLMLDQAVDIHGSGRQVRDLVHVDDVVAAIHAIAESTKVGTWNVATGVGTTILELLDRVREVTASGAPVRFLPARSGDVSISRLSIERIGRELGWQPRLDLGTGLAATHAELRSMAIGAR